MVKKIGLIAEDLSDVEVLKILIRKLSSKNISCSHFIGKGCGPLAKKTPVWCKNLHTKGCSSVLLVHDLDRHNAITLRAKLEEVLHSAPQIVKMVVIPSEELEAWLLSDLSAISSVLGLKVGLKEIHHPESVQSPKEHIGALVRQASKKEKIYINTVHNPLIAKSMDIAKIDAKCPSFAKFSEFVAKVAA